MLKRELTRIAFAGGIGIILALYLFFTGETEITLGILLVPVYCIGAFYAATTLFRLVGRLFKIYFSAQFFSLLVNPFWGTVICLFLLVIGLCAAISFGWIYGLGKCIVRIVKASKLDRGCKEGDNIIPLERPKSYRGNEPYTGIGMFDGTWID